MTEDERELLELILKPGRDGGLPDGSWEKLIECRKAQLDRQNPEWRQQMLNAYQAQRRAHDEFARHTQMVLGLFGQEELHQIYTRLEKGELP